MTALIEFIGVSCYTEDGATLFKDANLSLSSGENVMITAPTGQAGLSVFIQLVSGLVRPDGGSVFLFGEDINELSPEELKNARKNIGFVFQDARLISNLKVIENVALPLLYHTDKSRHECMERALMLLDKAGFGGNVWALPGPLPPYVKKEVAVAKALAMEPQVVICENLSTGLVDDEMEHLSGLLLEYKAVHGDCLLVSITAEETDADFFKPNRVLTIRNHAFE